MAYTNIDDPSAYFQALTYTGNSSSPRDLVNDGNSDLQPDLVWVKGRSHADLHLLYDSNRGAGKFLRSSSTATENTGGFGVTAFNTDGFRTNAYAYSNENTHTYAAWQWKANGGTTASNTDGDLTSTVQFNSTAGFSIVTYTGKSPIEPLDVGHGMGEVPDVIIVKNRSSARLWAVYHKDLTSPAANRYLQLNTSTYGELANSTMWRNEAPTTTVFKTGENAAVNQPNENLVAYCWKERQGYSKFGKYYGSGGTGITAPFVYTGFKPEFVIVRRIDSANSWIITDNARGQNGINPRLYANSDEAEGSAADYIDHLSNGFKIRTSAGSMSASGGSYIYMAFAENPFTTSTGVPCTAR